MFLRKNKRFLFSGKFGDQSFNAFTYVKGKRPSKEEIEFVENYVENLYGHNKILEGKKAVVTHFQQIEG